MIPVGLLAVPTPAVSIPVNGPWWYDRVGSLPAADGAYRPNGATLEFYRYDFNGLDMISYVEYFGVDTTWTLALTELNETGPQSSGFSAISITGDVLYITAASFSLGYEDKLFHFEAP